MLLPAAERRGEIHFYVARPLPYGARLTASFFLMLTGIVLQFPGGKDAPVFMAAGAVCLFAGVLLLLAKGYENKARTVPDTAAWRPARRTEIERILAISRAQREWDQDFFDITNGRGVLGLVAVGLMVVTAAVVVSKVSERHAWLILLDAAVLLPPFWITGVRSILKNDRLVVKAEALIAAEKAWGKAKSSEGEQFVWQLQVAKTVDGTGDIPHDVKAMLQFENSAPAFLGLQMQVAINSVNGLDYPYFYCILVGKTELGLLEKAIEPPPSGITVEPKHQGGVDVVVIRQATSKNSGYSTSAGAIANIFLFSLEQARRIRR